MSRGLPSAASMKAKRHFTVTLPADLAEQLHVYMEHGGFLTLPDAVRSCIYIALSSTPTEGAMEASARRAYCEARDFLLQRTYQFLREIQDQLKQAAGRVA